MPKDASEEIRSGAIADLRERRDDARRLVADLEDAIKLLEDKERKRRQDLPFEGLSIWAACKLYLQGRYPEFVHEDEITDALIAGGMKLPPRQGRSQVPKSLNSHLQSGYLEAELVDTRKGKAIRRYRLAHPQV